MNFLSLDAISGISNKLVLVFVQKTISKHCLQAGVSWDQKHLTLQNFWHIFKQHNLHRINESCHLCLFDIIFVSNVSCILHEIL